MICIERMVKIAPNLDLASVHSTRGKHPLVTRQRISLRNYQAAKHIAVRGPFRQPTEDDLVLSRSGLARECAAT